RWAPGLNVLTGETGAGKSILVDAVSALMGSRMGADWVRGGADRALIEGGFELPPPVEGAAGDDERPPLAALLAQYDLLPEGEDTLILSREISRSSGRTLCRVNGRPVLVGVLQEIGRYLIDIHGQSEHLSLLRVREHLDLLDRFGGTLA